MWLQSGIFYFPYQDASFLLVYVLGLVGDWVGRQNDLRFKSTSMIMKFKEFARVGFVSSNLELNNFVDRYMTK